MRERSPNPEKGIFSTFTPMVREILTKKNCPIYFLYGDSITDLQRKGKGFWRAGEFDRDFESTWSVVGEVAIIPSFFLPRSNRLGFSDQKKLVKKYSEDINTKDISVAIGDASTYAELLYLHLDRTGERLLGEKFEFDYIRTRTLVEDKKSVLLGVFDNFNGIQINRLDVEDEGQFRVWTAPLLLPRVA